MQVKNILHTALLSIVIATVTSSCFTKNITGQMEVQKALLSPQLTQKCWSLSHLSDSTQVKYSIESYQFKWRAAGAIGAGLSANYYYDDPVKETTLLTGDYFSENKIDDNAADCSDGLTINESNHLFFKAADYPDFNRKQKVYYSANVLRETESSALNPRLYDNTKYYYEELYFEPSGNFQKKVYLDNSCNFISVTGKWSFRTPFAGQSYTEIVLTYDNANRAGIVPKDDVYKITFFSDNGLQFEKKYVEIDSNFLATRGHYSIIADEIHYVPQGIRGGGTTTKFGRVVNYGKRVCSPALQQPDDRITIDDPLTLIKSREYVSVAGYFKKDIRKCDDSTRTDAIAPETGKQEPGNSHGGWEAYAGLALSTKSGTYPDYQLVPGGQIGIEKHLVNLSDEISLSGGAAYSMQGGKYESHEYIPGGNYGTSSNTSRLNYLNFPVMARYQKQRQGFFAEAGVQPGILVSAKDKGKETTDIKDEIEKFDVGIPVGVGYKFKNKFGVGVRITPGLINVNKDKQFNNKNMVVSLRATCTL